MTPIPLPKKMWLAWCCYLAGMTAEQISYSTATTSLETTKSRLRDVRRRLGIHGDNRITAARIPFTLEPKETP